MKQHQQASICLIGCRTMLMGRQNHLGKHPLWHIIKNYIIFKQIHVICFFCSPSDPACPAHIICFVISILLSVCCCLQTESATGETWTTCKISGGDSASGPKGSAKWPQPLTLKVAALSYLGESLPLGKQAALALSVKSILSSQYNSKMEKS